MIHHGGEPYMTPIDSKAYKAAAKAMETTFGKKPIPVVAAAVFLSVLCLKKNWELKSYLWVLVWTVITCTARMKNLILLIFIKALKPFLIFISILRRWVSLKSVRHFGDRRNLITFIPHKIQEISPTSR